MTTLSECTKLIERGVAVYMVGEDAAGGGFQEVDADKWFVSVLADSPMAETVRDIPLADTEAEAWDNAWKHYAEK